MQPNGKVYGMMYKYLQMTNVGVSRFLVRKSWQNLERLRKPDTNHRKQHAVHQQDYDELYTQTQIVTPISFNKEETQNLITDRQLSFVDGSQIIS